MAPNPKRASMQYVRYLKHGSRLPSMADNHALDSIARDGKSRVMTTEAYGM